MVLRAIIVCVLFLLGNAAFSDSIDYTVALKRITAGDVSAAAPVDGGLVLATEQGQVLFYNTKEKTSKTIWSTGERIDYLEAQDTLVALLCGSRFSLITASGNLLFERNDDLFVASSIAFSSSEVIQYTDKEIFYYNWRSGYKRRETPKTPLNKLFCTSGHCFLAFGDGGVEIRKGMSDRSPRTFKPHQTNVIYVSGFKTGFVTCSVDSVKIWNPAFTLIKSLPLNVGENVTGEEGFLHWSDYGVTFYRYDLQTEKLTTFYDPGTLPPTHPIAPDTNARVLLYDAVRDTVFTIASPEQRIGAMALSSNGDSLLLAAMNGQLCVMDVRSRNLTCGPPDRFYEYPLFLSWRQGLYMIGTSTGIAKVTPLKVKKSPDQGNLIEMAYGFLAFNSGHFGGNNQYAVITASSNAYSYLVVAGLENFPPKDKKTKKKKTPAYVWRKPCRDTLPILASVLIPGSEILVFSRGKELIFFDYLGDKVVRKLQVERPITALYYLNPAQKLLVGDEQGFVRSYSLSEERWVSDYEKFCSKAVVSLTSTPFGDTLFIGGQEEIVVCGPAGNEQRRLNYPHGITTLLYSEKAGGLIYASPKTPTVNFYEWVEPATSDPGNKQDEMVAVIRVIPGSDGVFLLTRTDVYHFVY